jgi:hypothetical protein
VTIPRAGGRALGSMFPGARPLCPRWIRAANGNNSLNHVRGQLPDSAFVGVRSQSSVCKPGAAAPSDSAKIGGEPASAAARRNVADASVAGPGSRSGGADLRPHDWMRLQSTLALTEAVLKKNTVKSRNWAKCDYTSIIYSKRGVGADHMLIHGWRFHMRSKSPRRRGQGLQCTHDWKLPRGGPRRPGSPPSSEVGCEHRSSSFFHGERDGTATDSDGRTG